MRYARRSMQSMQPDQSVQSKQSAQNSQGCRRQMNGCPDTHDHFPADMPIGMAYVPWQKWPDEPQTTDESYQSGKFCCR